MKRREPIWCAADAIFLVGLAVALLGLALLGSCGDRPDPNRPTLALERRACLAEAPPALPVGGVFWEACTGQTGFVACLDREAAVRLIDYLTRLKRYAADAWTRCGPLLPEETQP